jgi:uncharacterized protein
MKTASHPPEALNVEAFARDGAHLSGTQPLPQFERLAASAVAVPAGAVVAWQVRGELRTALGDAPQVWLHLAGQGEIDLECQRCLEPVRWTLDVDRWLQFVAGEDAAEALDADSEHDVLPLTRRLDLFEVLEDELLLALPLIARHESCPGGAPSAAPEDAEPDAPHPFAALAALKRGSSGT